MLFFLVSWRHADAAGIGVWSNILRLLSLIAVVTNLWFVWLLTFNRDNSRSNLSQALPGTFDSQRNIVWTLLVAEHVLLLLKFVMWTAVPQTPNRVLDDKFRQQYFTLKLETTLAELDRFKSSGNNAGAVDSSADAIADAVANEDDYGISGDDDSATDDASDDGGDDDGNEDDDTRLGTGAGAGAGAGVGAGGGAGVSPVNRLPPLYGGALGSGAARSALPGSVDDSVESKISAGMLRPLHARQGAAGTGRDVVESEEFITAVDVGVGGSDTSDVLGNTDDEEEEEEQDEDVLNDNLFQTSTLEQLQSMRGS